MTIIATLPQRYHNGNYNSRDNDNNGAIKTPLSDDTNNADNYDNNKHDDNNRTITASTASTIATTTNNNLHKLLILFKICKLFGATTHSYICNVSGELITTGLSQAGEMRSRKATRNKNTIKSNSK